MFVAGFADIDKQLSELKQNEKTDELRKKLGTLEASLNKTQAAVAPAPKAHLQLTFTTDKQISYDDLISSLFYPLMVPVQADGTVHVELWYINPTDVNTGEGFIAIYMAEGSSFAKEPEGFTRNQSDLGRKLAFRNVEARSFSPPMSLDIIPSPHASYIEIGTTFRCQDCDVPPGRLERRIRLARRP